MTLRDSVVAREPPKPGPDGFPSVATHDRIVQAYLASFPVSQFRPALVVQASCLHGAARMTAPQRKALTENGTNSLILANRIRWNAVTPKSHAAP